MKKQVITGIEAKQQLLEGAKLLYDAVSTTLGPLGQNAVIEAYGEPVVTHDGVTVAKSIEVTRDDRPGIRVGIEMIKASSSKTNDNVGDGTTSSTILTYHLMERALALIPQKNPMVLRRELDEAAKLVLESLEKLSEPLKTEKAKIEVATISSEDKVIGEKVGKMYHALGDDPMVAVEVGTKPETEFEIIEGYTFERGLIDQALITDTRTQTTTIDKPLVLVTDRKLGFTELADLFETVYNDGHDEIVLICSDFKPDLLHEAIARFDGFKIIGVKAPGFGDQRAKLLEDVAQVLGTKVLKGENPTMDHLGTCDRIVSSLKETIITGGKDVSKYIKVLKSQIDTLEGEFEKEKLTKRISQLHAKVGQIKVGGNTEMEAEERKYLIDDATSAVEAALKDGVVPGGGTTYVELARTLDSNTDGAKILKSALEQPFKILMENAGERSGVRLKELTEFGKGFDVMGDMKLVNLKEHGIIDPVMVIRQAITNAVSVASSAITTGVLIVNEKEKEDEEKE